MINNVNYVESFHISFKAHETGTYEIIFDNRQSLISSKYISYQITIIQPNIIEKHFYYIIGGIIVAGVVLIVIIHVIKRSKMH